MSRQKDENPRPLRLPIVSGPTAAGKSGLALELAERLAQEGFPAEIINADSVQVYKYMDIGSDKLPEAERRGIPHHLIGIALPDEIFSAARFRDLARPLIERISREGKVPIAVGGTGFYIRVLLHGLFEGPGRDPMLREKLRAEVRDLGLEALHQRLGSLDPESALRIHPHDEVRIVRALEVIEISGRPMTEHFLRHQQSGRDIYRPLYIGLSRERDELYSRINARVDQMVEAGLAQEVRNLRSMGYGPDLVSQKTLGYRRMHQYLDGLLPLEEAVERIKLDTRHYARRQLTWLRKEPLTWMNPATDREKIMELVLRFVDSKDD